MKNIYEMLNECKIDLSEYTVEELTDIEKKLMMSKLKKSMKKTLHYKKYTAVAAVMICVVILFTGFGDGVYAQMKALASDIATYLNIDKNLDDYKTVVNQSISDKNYTITLNEVVLNNDELIVSYTVQNQERAMEDGDGNFLADIKINGKRISNGGGGSSIQINDYTSQDVMSYPLSGTELDGDLDIKLTFVYNTQQGDEVRGDWAFEFTTNGDELRLATKEIPIHHKVTLPDGVEIELLKYTSNVMGQKIYFELKNGDIIQYDMVLEGQDDLGNIVHFYLSQINQGKGNFEIETINNGNLSETAAQLTLTPYAVKFPEESGRMSNDFKACGDAFSFYIN